MRSQALKIMVVVCAFGGSSCTTYLTPAMTATNNLEYLPRPVTADTTQVKSYVSGSISTANAPDGQLSFTLGMLNFSRGHTFNIFNFGYGAFGFAGSASYTGENDQGTLPDFRKSIYGGGMRTTVGYHRVSQSGNINFRVINWETALSVERGAYADYRKQIFHVDFPNSERWIYVSDRSLLFTTGLSSEIIRKVKDQDLQFALKLFAGITPGLNKSFRELTTPSAPELDNGALVMNLFFKSRKMYGCAQFGSETNSGSKLALGYTF